MKAAIYLGKENVEVQELPDPICGDHDVIIKNIYSTETFWNESYYAL